MKYVFSAVFLLGVVVLCVKLIIGLVSDIKKRKERKNKPTDESVEKNNKKEKNV